MIIGSLDPENIQKYKEQKVSHEKKKDEVLKIIEESKYIDITKKWLGSANPNSHKVQDMNYFEHNGIKYKVDNKNIVLDYSMREKEVAEWLENTFGGELYMIPRVNKPNDISTPDYLWNKEKWDLKEVVGESNRAVDNAIKRKKNQSNNFIIDITKNKLSEDLLKQQVKKIYHTAGREWVNRIILKKNKKVIVIYKRK